MNVYLLQIVNGIGIGMLYFLLAVGLSIVFGLLRFVNFAHGAFYLLGAYFCYQAMQWSMNFWVALVVVPIVVGALAWVVEKLVLRHVYAQQHEFHILVTVGLALVLQECVILIWGPLGNNVPVPDSLNGVVIWGGFIYPKYRLFVIGFTAVLAAAAVVVARRHAPRQRRAGGQRIDGDGVAARHQRVARVQPGVRARRRDGRAGGRAGGADSRRRSVHGHRGAERRVRGGGGGRSGQFSGCAGGRSAGRHRAERDEHAVARRRA
jgi:hypothetical protein